MLDIYGINEFGVSQKNKNGIFVYKDGSIGIGFKIPGIKFYTMTIEEKERAYENLRNIIGQLELLFKDNGALYQFISSPNYNIDDYEKDALNANYIEKNEHLKDNRKIIKGILNKNIKDSFDIYRKANVVKRDNFIFVRLYINFNQYKITSGEFLKKIFILQDSDKENMNIILDKMETLIESHNSKFRRIKAVPLNLIEMINTVRNYFGFSSINKLPNLNIEDNPIKTLFPGKIIIEDEHIKTVESIDIKEEKKQKLRIDNDKLTKVILQQRKKDENTLLEANSVDYKKMDKEINEILKTFLGRNPLKVIDIDLKTKLDILKYEIKSIFSISNIKEKIENLEFFNYDTLKIYNAEKEFNPDTTLFDRETYLKIYSVNELPSTLNIFHGNQLNQMYGDYTLTLNFKKLETTDVQTKMRRQIVLENVKIGMPIMKWFVPIEAVQEKIEILRNMIRTLDSRDFQRVDFSLYLTLRSNSPKDEREQNIGQYENITDMKWIAEKHRTPFLVFTNTMPTGFSKTGVTFSKRNLILNTTNIAQLSPCVNEEIGAKTPILCSIGYNSLVKINLNEAKAGHLSIQGGTGGGKSFFANKMLLQYLMYGDKGITTEKGDSFTRNTLFFGGKVYKPDMNGTIKINPFVMPKARWTDNEMKQQIYRQMTAAMAQMCDNYNEDVKNIYHKLLKGIFETKEGNPNRQFLDIKNFSVTPSTILEIMKQKGWTTNQFSGMLSSFEKYTNNGIYGALFDGNEGLNMDYPLINIDYSKLTDPAIKDFVFKSLLQNIFNEMSKNSGQTFFNINDEFWDAIATSGASGSSVVNSAIGQVESFFRVARKLGGKIAVVSQAISDIADSPLANAVLNNIYHSVFTNTSTAGELKIIKELFQFQDHQLEEIKTLSQVKGEYSEYFILAPYGEKIGGSNVERKLTTKYKYFPTPFETALFTTHPKEKMIFKKIYEELGEGGDPANVSQETVMKAVRLFMDITPTGVESDFFQEKVLMNKNDYWFTYKQLIEEKHGSVSKARNTLNWHEFIKLVDK